MNSDVKKKKRLKKWVYNLLFIIGGLVIGEVVAMLTKNISFLSWLSYEVPFGITSPIDVNLIIFRFQFGFYFVFCPALVFFIALALVIGNLMLSETSGNNSAKSASNGSASSNIAKVTIGSAHPDNGDLPEDLTDSTETDE